ncbi:hypothetical protein TcWFU_007119 [Taenia crassiceps]|uniref:Uncharacterized protein n=1 Tax=Taenia crassiceps TaxID=6207 RepID=A0ABR4QHW9_9CEST
MARAAALGPGLTVMEVKTIALFSTCLILKMIFSASQLTSAYMIAPQGYQSDQSQIVYKVPRRHSTKFKVFAECRRDCAGKCNHSLYAYLANKNECFTCLLECMLVFTEQAEKMGIRVNSEKTKRRTRRVTEFSSQSNSGKKKATPRSNYPVRSYARSQKK